MQAACKIFYNPTSFLTHINHKDKLLCTQKA